LTVDPGKAIDVAGPVEAKNYSVAVASILGTRARVFTSKHLKGGVSGQPLQTIPPAGTELEIKTPVIFELSNEETITLEPGNQPSMIISITASSDETEARSTGETAYLVLSSIPRDAEIHIDGESRGTAIATGTLRLPLSAATHKIYLSRPHFEDSQAITVNLRPGQTEKISGERFTLEQQGALVFKISPASASAAYQLAAPQQTSPLRRASAGDTVWTRPGRYVVKVEAQGYIAEQDQYEVKSGTSLEVTRSLKPLAVETPAPSVHTASVSGPFEDARQWTRSGNWWIFKKDTYGWLAVRNGIFEVTIQRPKKPFYALMWPQGGKRVEWTIDNRDGERIDYSITGNTFRRAAYRNGKPVSEHTKELTKHSKDYKLTFEVSARHIIVSEALNGKLDDFERPDPGVQLGKIGFKGEIAVTVEHR
jgi:antitoxin (DNA-binding transcriptional repressor) of toxin-antitoxin stability system